MTVLAALVLTVIAFIFIVYPLLRQKTRLSGVTENEKLVELLSERDTTYSMLKELEFDYQSGILTEEDYRELEARYKRKAISTLRDIDKVARSGGTEEEMDEIEQQVRKLRQSKTKPAISAPPSARKRFCPQCGSKTGEDDRFCASCGARLTTEADDV